MAKKDTNPNRKVKKPGEQKRQLRQVGNKEEKIETTIIEIPFNTVTKNLATNYADTTSKIVKEGKNGKK